MVELVDDENRPRCPPFDRLRERGLRRRDDDLLLGILLVRRRRAVDTRHEVWPEVPAHDLVGLAHDLDARREVDRRQVERVDRARRHERLARARRRVDHAAAFEHDPLVHAILVGPEARPHVVERVLVLGAKPSVADLAREPVVPRERVDVSREPRGDGLALHERAPRGALVPPYEPEAPVPGPTPRRRFERDGEVPGRVVEEPRGRASNLRPRVEPNELHPSSSTQRGSEKEARPPGHPAGREATARRATPRGAAGRDRTVASHKVRPTVASVQPARMFPSVLRDRSPLRAARPARHAPRSYPPKRPCCAGGWARARRKPKPKEANTGRKEADRRAQHRVKLPMGTSPSSLRGVRRQTTIATHAETRSAKG